MNEQDIAFEQQRAGTQMDRGLSTTPYYMQELDRKLDRIEWKLDKLLREIPTP